MIVLGAQGRFTNTSIMPNNFAPVFRLSVIGLIALPHRSASKCATLLCILFTTSYTVTIWSISIIMDMYSHIHRMFGLVWLFARFMLFSRSRFIFLSLNIAFSGRTMSSFFLLFVLFSCVASFNCSCLKTLAEISQLLSLDTSQSNKQY